LEKKIVVSVDSKQDLLDLHIRALDQELPCFIVSDAGLTELPPNTTTALAIGPGPDDIIDPITGDLKLL
jgi:PTH2 family peptidyl-tRNA hydrolase